MFEPLQNITCVHSHIIYECHTQSNRYVATVVSSFFFLVSEFVFRVLILRLAIWSAEGAAFLQSAISIYIQHWNEKQLFSHNQIKLFDFNLFNSKKLTHKPLAVYAWQIIENWDNWNEMITDWSLSGLNCAWQCGGFGFIFSFFFFAFLIQNPHNTHNTIGGLYIFLCAIISSEPLLRCFDVTIVYQNFRSISM